MLPGAFHLHLLYMVSGVQGICKACKMMLRCQVSVLAQAQVWKLWCIVLNGQLTLLAVDFAHPMSQEWPESVVPWTPIGSMVFEENIKNFHNEVRRDEHCGRDSWARKCFVGLLHFHWLTTAEIRRDCPVNCVPIHCCAVLYLVLAWGWLGRLWRAELCCHSQTSICRSQEPAWKV